MVLTPSTMLPLGTAVPAFQLKDTLGKSVGPHDYKDAPALVVAFICNHCPYVKHIQSGFARFARDYQKKKLAIIAINSNDVEASPEDSPAKMAIEARAAGYVFPFLFDESQKVAKAFHAACTPDIYLFDKSRNLVYRGQFDDSRPGNGKPVTGADLRAACDAVLAGKGVVAEQVPSIGCNIKWKVGNAPEYFAE